MREAPTLLQQRIPGNHYKAEPNIKIKYIIFFIVVENTRNTRN